MKVWKETGRATATDRKTFMVGMAMKDAGLLDRTLMELSTPGSPRYGKWLSKAEADELTATPKKVADEVTAWATSTGAKCVRLSEALECAGSVTQIEQLLDAELSYFVNTKTGEKIVRTSMAKPGAVPSRFAGKITVLTGLTQLPLDQHRLGSVRPEAAYRAQDTDYSIVPETLTKLYNQPKDESDKGVSGGPIEFQNYPAIIQTDSDTFATNVGLPKWTIPKNQTIGTFSPGAGAESALDEQYMVALSIGSNKWYWTEADWQFEFANHVLSLAAGKVPDVMSISYAWYENDQCDISPGVAPCTGKPVPAGSAAFVAATNALYAKIGARGISLISASGDSGAHGRTDPGCTDKHTRPDYPASSPYVTAVGGTELQGGTTTSSFKAPICKSTLQCADGGVEVVASNKMLAFFSSGGGFSTQSPMPAYQKTVVTAYINSKPTYPLPDAAYTNYSNYGFPVVSAMSHHYYVELGGQVQAVDGTSAATPTFAGLITSMNGWRKANGKPVLGFLNPLLYAAYAADPTAFNDVTIGDNSCTESACPCPANTGFGAVAGWDAATGLGTPNYEKIKAVITAQGW